MRRFVPLFGRTAVMAFCALTLTGALSSGPAHAGVFSISPEKEHKIGQETAEQIERGAPLVSGPVEAWVQRVGARLAAVSDPEFHYSFHVIAGPEINAFTLPGGYVYVSTGLRKVVHSDDELAAVLAHEITHAEHHHYAKQYSRDTGRSTLLTIGSLALGLPNVAQQAVGLLDFSLDQKYSREHEAEADHDGMLRMQRAGYNAAAMVTVLERLANEDESQDSLDRWLSDHPEGKKRVAAARALLGQMTPTPVPPVVPAPTETASAPAVNVAP